MLNTNSLTLRKSNSHQTLNEDGFSAKNIKECKVESLKETCKQLNEGLKIEIYESKLKLTET